MQMTRTFDQVRLLVFAPTRRAASETFIRANLKGLPFQLKAYFGDERPLSEPMRWLYGCAIWLSKLLTRLRLLRAAGLPAAWVARLLIRRHQPNVVLAEFGFEAVRVMHACRWTGVPLVVHFRGSDASARQRIGLLEDRYRSLLRIAAGIIVKSRPMADRLAWLGASRDRILISPSGADAALFHHSAPAQSAPIFLAVGRFVEKKGPLQTIDAFARMLAGCPALPADVQLWMVGDGPLLPAAQDLVQAQGIEDRVRLLGLRSQVEVAGLMREVRAFVQHSRVAADGDSEGSPVAVMEAQLSGLPVIATRHAGIPEVVCDGESGLLVEEGDVAAMALAMVRLVRDPGLAERMGACGRQRIQSGFTVSHHLEQVSNFLETVHRSNRSA